MYRMLLTMCMVLVSSFWATAQQPTAVQLNEHSSQLLVQGLRTRVIVEFAVDGPQSGELGQPVPNLSELIEEQSSHILRSAFGRDSEYLTRENQGAPRLRRVFRYTPAMVLEVDEAGLNALARSPSVTRISSDALERQFLNFTLRQIEALELQSAGHRGGNTTVAVLDGGIHYDHPAFDGRIVESGCFSSNVEADGSTSLCPDGVTRDTISDDAARHCTGINNNGCAHGTHVASIAAGAQNLTSPLGQYYSNGVAPDSSIIPVQVFSQFNDSTTCEGSSRCLRSYQSDQLAALEWLYENRETTNLTVINMSLGGELVSGSCPTDIRAPIISQLRAAGVATVIASGNLGDPYSVTTPACVESAIRVAGVSRQLNLTGNYGPLVDFVAPATATAAGPPSVQNLTLRLSGTSIAAPHVAGAFAVLRGANPEASVSEIEQALSDTAILVNNPAGNDHRMIQILPAYLSLTDEVIEIQRPANTHYSRQYNSTGTTTDPAAYHFTNNGIRPETWRIEFDIEAETLVTFSGGNALRDNSNWNLYSGTIGIGETMTVWIDPDPDFDGGIQSLDFLGGGQAFSDDLTFEVYYPPPSHDDLVDARSILDPLFAINSRTGEANYQSGEITDPDFTGSVWYEWRPGIDANLRLVSSNPVYVYTGSLNDISTLTEVGHRYQESQGSHYVDINVEASQTYIIRVLVRLDEHQNWAYFGLAAQNPDSSSRGEAPGNARLLTDASGYFISTVHKSSFSEVPENDPFDGEVGHFQVWFQWTAPYSGNFSISNKSPIWRTGRGWGAPSGSLSLYRRTDNSGEHSPGDDPELLERIAHQAFESGQSDTWDQRQLNIEVEQGRSYWIRFMTTGNPRELILTYGQENQRASRLFGAVLPAHRNVQDGTVITAFMSIINPVSQQETARNCRIEPIGYLPRRSDLWPYNFAGNFQYQATDAANTPIGIANQPFDIDPGEVQSFIISFDPAALMEPEVLLTTICDNVLPDFASRDTFGTFSFVTVDRPVSDIITIAVSPSNNGIINVPNGQTRAFSVAAINIGGDGSDIRVSASRSYILDYDPPRDSLLSVEICETNPSNGQCLSDRGERQSVHFAPGDVRTFTVFIRAEGRHAYFSPRDFRATVRFDTEEFDGTHSHLRSETSVAIRTLGD